MDNIKNFHVDFKQLIYLYLYFFLIFIIFTNLPKTIWMYSEGMLAALSFGVLGIWRYSWWAMHACRSLIYAHIIFPIRRYKADALWDSGWRPRKLFFMMTTFKELSTTTEKVLQTIILECNSVKVNADLFIGIGCESDEIVINDFIKNNKISFVNIIIIRQKLPGKRYAIGSVLRELINHGLEENDPVIFIDGDTYFTPGCLQKCLAFFPLFPKLQALTTHEKAIINNGPNWMKKWLEMRFTQRDFTMKSYALSNKILTLTGRMSIFRGKHVLEPEFINIIENDHLHHWLWGDFRFLSGDDKSTWYYLLKAQADMFYIPDAMTITIEYINGDPVNRMIENLRRWSGNTLRNGARAIALGPHRIGFFIWWCIIDQHLSIWTMFIGHLITLVLSIFKSFAFIILSLIWIALSRFIISMPLFYYSRRLDMSYPLLLYINQLLTTIIKIYTIFRLPQQRWKNRGEQESELIKNNIYKFRSWTATYLTFFYCLTIFIFVLVYLKIISWPTLSDIVTFFMF